MNILIVNNGSRHLVALQHRLQDHSLRITGYAKLSLELERWADVIILSGGNIPVLPHRLLYRRQIELVKSFRKPVIGICLGHELIGLAYGVRPKRLLRRVKGLAVVSVGTSTLSGLLPGEFKVWEAHRWALKRSPVDFDTIGISKQGVEIMKHKRKPIYSTQFHPEVISPANDGMKVFDAILSAIK